MEFEIFQKQSFSTLKDLEKSFEKNFPALNIEPIKWEAVEEIAVGYTRGSLSKIHYYSIPEGCKVNYFSYKKVNHAILMIISDENFEKNKTDYYRLLRKLKPSSQRVVFLADCEAEITKELKKLLEMTLSEYEIDCVCQFSFHVLKRDDIRDFLNLCRENQIKNLEYTNTFPVDIDEEETIGSFVSKEIFLFSGEIQEEKIAQFISGLIESGFNVEKFFYHKVNKIKKSF